MNHDPTHLQLAEQQIMKRLQDLEPSRRQRVLQSLVAAALGSIPWVGAFITASLDARDGSAQLEITELGRQFVQYLR